MSKTQVHVLNITRNSYQTPSCVDVVLSNNRILCSDHPEWGEGEDSDYWTLREVDPIEPALDHKELLEKYIRYVRESEGTDFLGYRDEAFSGIKFTDAEWEELLNLRGEDGV